MPEKPNDATSVGSDKSTKDYVDKYDAEHGKYRDNIPAGSPNTAVGPAAPDPSPFKIGPT